jgi:peptidyl-prolyl cis-trans isomerase A (cyclophilin A)
MGIWLATLMVPMFVTGAGVAPSKPSEWLAQGKTVFAVIKTEQGNLVIKLDPHAAPKSVEAFVGLASGEREWISPSGEKVHKPLYDGTSFLRTVPDFLIQGGDPKGDGSGGPGFGVPDETGLAEQQALHFTRGTVGLMRVPDPKVSGCQFFIVLGDAPWLDKRFVQIGQLVSGQEVADRIAQLPRGALDKPLKPVVIEHVALQDTFVVARDAKGAKSTQAPKGKGGK